MSSLAETNRKNQDLAVLNEKLQKRNDELDKILKTKPGHIEYIDRLESGLRFLRDNVVHGNENHVKYINEILGVK